MKQLCFILITLITISCAENSEGITPNHNNDQESSVSPLSDLDTTDILQETDNTSSIDTFNIKSYFEFFAPEIPLSSIKVSREVAHDYNSFMLLDINYKQGYISYITQHTPPSWDGDSKTEYLHDITYWIKPDGTRLIAKTKTEVTWVSDKTLRTEFYLHDANGIHETESIHEYMDDEKAFRVFDYLKIESTPIRFNPLDEN